MRLFDPLLTEGRPPVSKPTESAPQAVANWPGWYWWTGVNGMMYARRPLTSPPKVVRGHNFTALLDGIRKAEKRSEL